MFDNYKEFFHGLAPLKVDKSQINSRDLMISVVVLLAHIAHSDTEFETEEMTAILGQLFSEFGFHDHDGAELLEVAQFLVQDGSKIDQYIQTLNENFDDDQRQIVLAMIWSVIIADGVVEKFEASQAAALRSKLNLTMEQAVRARKLSEERQVKAQLTRLMSVGRE